jgi:hypothetical protein
MFIERLRTNKRERERERERERNLFSKDFPFYNRVSNLFALVFRCSIFISLTPKSHYLYKIILTTPLTNNFPT